MIYRQDKTQKKIRTPIILGALFALILLFFLKGDFLKRLTMPVALRVYLPFSYLKKIILSQSENLLTAFREKKSLYDESKRLEARIAELEAEALIADSFEKENRILKDLLGLDAREQYIVSNVIRRENQFLSDNLIIDAGEDKGVFKDMKATAFSRILLGKIIESSQSLSVVQLISSPGVETYAVIEGPPAVPASVVGQGGGNLLIKLPRSFEVKIGERVLALGNKPLLIGIVEYVKKDSAHSLQEIFLRLPLNLSELGYVSVYR